MITLDDFYFRLFLYSVAVCRVLSLCYIFLVLKLQWRLFQTVDDPDAPDLTGLRRNLFTLASAILIGNIIPVIYEVGLLWSDLPEHINVPVIAMLYVLSSGLTSFLGAYFIWRLYPAVEATESSLQREDKET